MHDSDEEVPPARTMTVRLVVLLCSVVKCVLDLVAMTILAKQGVRCGVHATSLYTMNLTIL
ncbi:hypothetical protein D3C86_1924610 [compost metagenome]